MPFRILLYDDNEFLRSSLSTLLQWNGEYEMAAALPDATSLHDDIAQLKPDVVLMDIDMPPSNGVQALKLLRRKYPDLPVIMLTVFEDNDHIVEAICAGASGYLLKKDIDQVIPAIRDVLNGGAPMTSTVARKVLQLFPGRSGQTEFPEALTPRENETLNLLVKGYSYKMIAAELQLALETVRSHIKNIYRKLQVSSATEAVYKVSRRS